MAYKVINEELKIASCRIADLTMDQVTAFLKVWDDDSKIGTLTLFYDQNNDYLVLNEDNNDFQLYLEIAETYLKASKEGRKKLMSEAPASLLETLRVIKWFEKRRFINTWIDRACKNEMNSTEREMVKHIPCGSVCTAFKLGVIRGKRIERARRKRGALNAPV